MTTIITRLTGGTAKNAPLTNTELDNNFINLNTDKVEASGTTITLSGTGAIKVQSGTTGQRPSPVAGMIRYNSTTTAFEGYRLGAWSDLGTTAYTEYPFTATASQTTFDVGIAMTLVNVFLNGLRLAPTTDYSISGTNIVLTTGAALNDILIVLVFSGTANTVGSVSAAAAGLTAVTAVTGSLTLATGGVTIASQAMASGLVWRVTAYGTYVASSSATVRNLSMGIFWGSTALTAVTTGAVLASTAQTTVWKVEFIITGSSTTAAWCTGTLSAQVTSGTIGLNYIATAASVGSLTTTSTVDFRVGQTGTAVSGDTINVHSVTIERIK